MYYNIVKGLLSVQVNSSDLVSLISFKIPPRKIRSTIPFYIPICSINCMKYKPIIYLMLMANENPSIDI